MKTYIGGYEIDICILDRFYDLKTEIHNNILFKYINKEITTNVLYNAYWCIRFAISGCVATGEAKDSNILLNNYQTKKCVFLNHIECSLPLYSYKEPGEEALPTLI